MKEHILKIRLVIFFTVLSVVLFITVGILFFRSTKGIIRTSKEKEIETLSDETANKIDRFLFERYGDINAMSNSPVLQEAYMSNKLKLELIESIKNAYKTYDYISITDNIGKICVSSGKINGDMYYKNFIDYVLKGNLYVSDITYLSKDKAYVIYFAAPIIQKNGQVKGAVVERMNFSSLLNIIKNVQFGKSGFAFLMQQDGKFIITDGNTKHSLNLNNFLQTNKKVNYYKNNGKKMLYAYCPINAYSTQKNKWYLIVQEPSSEAFKVSTAFKNYIIILLIISLTIIIIFAFISADKIIKPFSIMNKSLKSMNQKVSEMSEELEKSDIRAKNLESLAAMSAGLAHEIRNPLTSIKGYAQFIKTEIGENNELNEDMTVIISEVDRLNNITEKFLSFARPKKPDLSMNNVNDIIKEAVKAIKNEITNSRIDIIMKLNDVPNVLMDKEQIEEVIINIILNSIQAIDNNGKIDIITLYMKEFDMVRIMIRDNGVGIKDEDQESIFEPFYTTKENGSGLGLAICSRIIENHGGYINFKSKAGNGTEFSINLPAAKA